MLRHAFLDFIDRNPPAAGTEHFTKHIFSKFNCDGSIAKCCIGRKSVERAFKLTHIGCYTRGEQINDIIADHHGAKCSNLRGEDRAAQRIFGRLNVGH